MVERMCFMIVAIVLFGRYDEVHSKPRSVTKAILDPDYVKIVTILRKLEPKMSKEDLRMIMALGIVQGALDVKKSMEKNLTDSVADLVLNLDMSDKNKTMLKIKRIERMIERDTHSIQLLGGSLDFARGKMTAQEFHMDMKKELEETSKLQQRLKDSRPQDVVSRLGQLKREVLEHLEAMREIIDSKAGATILHLERKRNKNKNSSVYEILDNRINSRDNTDYGGLKETLVDAVEQNLIEASRRQDLSVEFDTREKEDQVDKSQSEELNEDSSKGQGGLVGIIANLSGGEEGSDIGALFGAVTGVVMRLFGPNGLDIESLIASGTALISGLLSGENNFGTVLGGYVGTAVDGLSGGGGAINNGQFFGNFLGTLVARLSADPEDDELPPKPQLFLQNFLSSFMKAKGKSDGAVDQEDGSDHSTGSDSFGFIRHVVRAAVGGITSFILNASLGSSAGSSNGSGALFSSSSHPKYPKQPSHAEWNA